MVSKKGLSAVIASVLLILLVLVLAAIIFTWSRGFFSEQIEKFGKSGDSVCNSVVFDVAVIGNAGGEYSLEIVNKGNVAIGAFDFKVYSGGDSKVVRAETGLPAYSSLSFNVLLNVLPGAIDKIEVFPVLRGTEVNKRESSFFVCNDNSIFLKE